MSASARTAAAPVTGPGASAAGRGTARPKPAPATAARAGFISPALRALIARRAASLAGLALGLLGLALLVALASYDPRDPSPDTATARAAGNLAGPLGATLSDILLQGYGLAGGLPGLAMLAWAWRIASHRGIGSLGARIAAVLAAMPVVAAALALPDVPLAWPAQAGPGGAIGRMLSQAVTGIGQQVLGPVGYGVAVVATVGLAILLFLLALGLSLAEWRWFGRGISRAARASALGGREAAGLAAGGMGRLQRMAPSVSPRLPSILSRVPAMTAAAPPADTLVRVPPAGPIAPAPGPAPAADEAPPPSRVHGPVAARRAAPRQEQLPLAEAGWRCPPLSLLKPPPPRAQQGPSPDALEANARLLETVLSDYGVQGAIVDIRPGPVVTLYELEPAPGIRSARVIGLADDIARSLSVTAVRIATVPGRNVIGIEIPNARRDTVFLSEIMSTQDWVRHPGKLVLALGKEISGAAVLADLARMPHLMIAGTTGSGKSVGVNAMILSLLYRLSPDQCRLILIDPKMLELSVYDGIPHLMAPVVTEPAKAVTALKWTVREMERRYRAMSLLGVRNIGSYNDRVVEARAKGEVVTRRVQTGFDPDTGRPTFEEQPLALEPLPFIVVVVDEMADLMMVAGKEIEAAVQRLAQMARAAGIHVIMATQRPSVDVITGTIKANFPTRISFQVISKFDSRTILGEQGAEQLLGQGDMLFMAGGGRITRVHGPFVSDREVEEVVSFLRAQGEPSYLDEVTEALPDDAGGTPGLSGIAGASEGEKGLFDQAVDVVAREGKASTSFIQRHLNIGYNRAAKLIEQMEREGIVGPANHVGKREVLVRRIRDDE
jgi:S-DNA-T family DNA segregation ATPase FtsK/SpoIIIE